MTRIAQKTKHSPATIPILKASDAATLLTSRALRLADAERVVAPILEDVRKRGDAAVLEYARRFDGFEADSLAIGREEWQAAFSSLDPKFVKAVSTASGHIRAFAEMQLPVEHFTEFVDGRRLGWVVRPLESMGAYVPAGRYPLPSTMLMTVIPAQVAGVRTTVVVCPKPSPEVLGVAACLSVSQLFRIGGAHAIAALAFGTETVPKVDRIVGPGNQYVAAAKKLLAGETAIDFVAGPTELVIIAAKGDARYLAADLLAQAEHDTEATAILMTTSPALAEAVATEIDAQLETMPTAPVARQALRRHGCIVLVDSLEHALDLSNQFAPEHLMLPDSTLLPGVQHAGSVFLGSSSPEAAGDYCTGPNHVLPTGGGARLRGGLSAADFVKVISVQELTPGALHAMAHSITTLARAEGLEGHARSVEARRRG